MKTTIFEYRDYKAYLNDLIRNLPNAGRGTRKALAEAIPCHVPYITHVLSGENHFSFEQAIAAAKFFGLSQEESEFLLLLVGFNKAATNDLREVYTRQIQDREEKHGLLKARLKMRESVNSEDQSTYYSSWHYAAVHMLLTIPEFQTRESIMKKLGLTDGRVGEIIEFLLSRQFIRKERNQYKVTSALLHLEKTSPLISKHHMNWRMRAVHSLDSEAPNDLHYSLVFTCSQSDIPKVREKITRCLEDCARTIKTSAEEKLTGLCVDLFSL